MNFELSYAKGQRPLPVLWAAGLLIVSGVFLLLPITFTTMVGRPWLREPDYATLLISFAALGVAQLGAAYGAWRGAAWPVVVVLAVIAAEIVFLVLGYLFVIIGIVVAGVASLLLLLMSSRAYAKSVGDASRSAV